MTFVALVLLGAGIIYIASALADETLDQTLQDFLAGKQIDWSGKAGAEAAVTPIDVSQQRPGETVIGGYPYTLSEGAAASILRNAWNYCVETTGVILAHATARGKGLTNQGGVGVPITGAEVVAQTQEMVARGWAVGRAGKYGVSDFADEQKELALRGVPTNLVNIGGMDLNAFKTSVVEPAIASGRPVGLEFYNPTGLTLYDQVHGKYWDQGVQGHAIAVEGYDMGGVYAADPNTTSPEGLITYYSWDNLFANQITHALIPQ